LSKYSTVTFVARCAPVNALIFGIATFDENISRPGEFLTYPSPLTFFSCSEGGTQVALDLTRLTIPQWWFESQKLDLSHQAYELTRVGKLFFGTSQQSPHNVASHAEISEVTLHGRDYRYLHALAVLLPASWLAFGVWFFRAHARALAASLDCKLKKDLALAAYRQLTLEPYRDREKAAILRFIATNYTNAELDLDGVAAATGTNRNKINEVLKTELGMTFTSYLNKLRLAEAARLLTENGAATVAEVAYGVGYGHVSYFNKLFKEEYGCTPKAFRTLAAQRDAPPAAA
jgi:AraC-like DNA-binding protein